MEYDKNGKMYFMQSVQIKNAICLQVIQTNFHKTLCKIYSVYIRIQYIN